jgi:Flp pilus assembly protein TadG
MAMDVKQAKRRGLETVEAAILLPFMLLLIFASCEYGWMFYRYQQITGAARDGARVAIRADAGAGDVTAAVASRMTSAGMGASGYSVSISPATPTQGQPVTVSVTVRYGNISLGLPMLPPLTGPGANKNITGSVTMTKEGS